MKDASDSSFVPSNVRTLPYANRRWVLLAIPLLLVILTPQWGYNIALPWLSFNEDVLSKSGMVLWVDCEPGSLSRARCGYVSVPKDYIGSRQAETASIAFSIYPATKTPKKGSVFLNPGGPGGAGSPLASRDGERYATWIGDDWDLIGFDPRGVGNTKPTTRCFPTPIDHQVYITNTVIEQGITFPSLHNSSVTDAELRDVLLRQYGEFLALKKGQGELCAKNMGDELKFMGTANVVRDIDFMAQVFEGEGSKINFHGGSYGSILGMYLVNMLPHRVGKVVIDGIADPVSWAGESSHLWAYNWLNSTEDTYRIFLNGCSKAGPETCALAKKKNELPEDIAIRLETFFDSLIERPLPVPFGNRPGILTSGGARGMLLAFLNSPTRWQEISGYFAEALAGNGTSIYNALVPDIHEETAGLTRIYDAQREAIGCVDSPTDNTLTAEDYADHSIKVLREVSIHFGASTGVPERDGGCEYWPVKGAERFEGPWNATLDYPMLVVSNTDDPITPMRSGLIVNSLMPNSSSLIILEGPGHTSRALPSLCVAKLKRAYFAGDVPANGTVCKQEVDPFAKRELDVTELDADDQRLWDALTAHSV